MEKNGKRAECGERKTSNAKAEKKVNCMHWNEVEADGRQQEADGSIRSFNDVLAC